LKTVPAALALGNPRETGNQPWLGEVVNSLIKAGDYSQALSVWQQMVGASARSTSLLRDADFRDSASPPPFNWVLTSSTVGLAERQHGQLQVLFYGDEDGTLASQLLLLTPGSYKLGFRLGGDAARAHALTWAIWCDKAPQALSAVTVDVAAARGWQFNVPAGCQAQWLRLSGVSADVPQQVDLSIGALTLVMEPSGA
jgi:pentatricopeptide repeat protein